MPVATLLTVGLAQATAVQPERAALVQIPVQTAAVLARVEAGGVPVYTHLSGDGDHTCWRVQHLKR